MSAAADLLVTIQEAGATIWRDGDRLKFQGLPAGMVPHIRDHKAELLVLLADYDTAEREAIQWESEQPPLEPLPDIPGFEGMPPLPAARHGVTCSACVRFQPGPQPLAIGRCLATDNGLPPLPRQGDYRAAYPMAKRHCCEFMGVSS